MASSGTAVLWDLDGTLVRLRVAAASVDQWRERLSDHFSQWGWDGGFRPLLGSLEAALAAVRQRDPAAAEQLSEAAYDALDEWELADTRAIDPIAPAIERFAWWMRCGVASAIVTNNGAPVAQRAVALMERQAAKLGWHLDLPMVLAVRQAGRLAKPAPDALEWAVDALRRRGHAVERVLMIGDSPADWEAVARLAKQTGLPGVAWCAYEGALSPAPPGPPESRPAQRSLDWGDGGGNATTPADAIEQLMAAWGLPGLPSGRST